MCLQSLAVDVFDVPEMLVCFFFGPLFGGGSACEREKNLVQKKKKLVLFLSYFFILKEEREGKPKTVVGGLNPLISTSMASPMASA